MKSVLLVLVALAAGATAIVMFNGSATGTRDAEAISLTGTVEAREIEIAADVPGRLVALNAEEGQHLKKGDLLAAVDDAEARLEVQRLQARMAIAQAELDDLRAKPRSAELKLQRSKILEAEVQREREQTALERQKTLQAKNASPAAEVDSATFSLRSASQRLETENRALHLLSAAPRKSTVEVARARLGELESELALAKLEVERTRVVAPVDGVVLSRNYQLGERVEKGAPLVTLIDLDEMWVELAVDETVHGRLSLGQSVQVRLEAAPQLAVAGRISYIADRHSFTPRNIETRAERAMLTFRVKVAIDHPPPLLKPGMFADVIVPRGHPAAGASAP
jgi:HlyD family secretion protein